MPKKTLCNNLAYSYTYMRMRKHTHANSQNMQNLSKIVKTYT